MNLAITQVIKRRPISIVSGINKGWNLGDDVTYSGTVSGALEGALLGIPSHRRLDASDGTSTNSGRRRGRGDGRRAGARAGPAEVHVPEHQRTAGEPNKGFRVTVQAKRNHVTVVDERIDPRRPAVLLDRRRAERVGAARSLGLPGGARRLSSRSRRCSPT